MGTAPGCFCLQILMALSQKKKKTHPEFCFVSSRLGVTPLIVFNRLSRSPEIRGVELINPRV